MFKSLIEVLYLLLVIRPTTESEVFNKGYMNPYPLCLSVFVANLLIRRVTCGDGIMTHGVTCSRTVHTAATKAGINSPARKEIKTLKQIMTILAQGIIIAG